MTILDWANMDGQKLGDWVTEAPQRHAFVSAWCRNDRHRQAVMEIMLPTVLHRTVQVIVFWRGKNLKPNWDVSPRALAAEIAEQASELLEQAIRKDAERDAT